MTLSQYWMDDHRKYVDQYKEHFLPTIQGLSNAELLAMLVGEYRQPDLQTNGAIFSHIARAEVLHEEILKRMGG